MQDDFTQLLQAWHGGDDRARDHVFQQVYQTLHGMALSRTRGAGNNVTLRPTVLVHDAMLRLMDGVPDCSDRAHFLALAALKMRAVLVDQARARRALKRGGGAISLTLSHADAVTDDADGARGVDVLSLHQALEDLAQRDPRAARSVEMSYFGGMSHVEIADVLGVSVPTVERDLRFARAWLNRKLA